jgi:hypothetical protein
MEAIVEHLFFNQPPQPHSPGLISTVSPSNHNNGWMDERLYSYLFIYLYLRLTNNNGRKEVCRAFRSDINNKNEWMHVLLLSACMQRRQMY